MCWFIIMKLRGRFNTNNMKEFRFEYFSHGEELMVVVEAKSLNDALIRFAKSYHEVELLYMVNEIKPLYRS